MRVRFLILGHWIWILRTCCDGGRTVQAGDRDWSLISRLIIYLVFRLRTYL